jgi:hypothetical protein
MSVRGAVLALALLAAMAASAAAESEYPALSADMSLQALYATQENFRVVGGIFGRSFGAEGGNFNDAIGDENYRNVLETQFGLGVSAQFAERVLGRFALEINPRYARGQGFGDPQADIPISSQNNLRLKNYYLEVEHDLGGFLGYRIGRQTFETPRALVVSDADADGMTLWWRGGDIGRFSLGAAALDSRGSREIEDVYAQVTYEFPADREYSGAFYVASLSFRDRTPGAGNAPPEISLGGTNSIGEWLMGPSNDQTASLAHGQLFWTGIEVNYVHQGLELGVDAVIDFGNVDPGYRSDARIDTVEGYLAVADASYGRDFWRVGGALAAASGHDPKPHADRYTGYLDIRPNFGFTRFFFAGGPYLVATGFLSPAVQGSGLYAAKVYAKFTPLDWLAVNLQTAALAAQYNRPQFANNLLVPRVPYKSVAKDAGSYYGTEVDLWLEFTPAERLCWLAEADYFQPGNYFMGPVANDEESRGFLADPDPAWRFGGGFLFK